MADFRDPNTATQFLVNQATGHRVPAEQISGTQLAYVLDNENTNPVINPPGTCRVVVPAYSVVSAFGPVAYPGALVPPGGGVPGPRGTGGTLCSVSFVPPTVASQSAAVAQILNFVSWPPVNGATNPPLEESTAGQTFFNTTSGQQEIFNGAAWVPNQGAITPSTPYPPLDIPTGTTFTVPTNSQVLFKQPITIEGTLRINGTGLLIGVA